MATAEAKVPATPTLADANRDITRPIAMPEKRFYLVLGVAAAGLALMFGAWFYQIGAGIGVAGITHPVFWGVYITTFVFWVGIAHSGTLISAILYLFRSGWRTTINRTAEAMTIFAVMTAGLFPLIHLGRVGERRGGGHLRVRGRKQGGSSPSAAGSPCPPAAMCRCVTAAR